MPAFTRSTITNTIYVVAVVPDVDTGSQVVIFHEGIDACECKYYSMTKQSFCEMVEVDGEWVDKFARKKERQFAEYINRKNTAQCGINAVTADD